MLAFTANNALNVMTVVLRYGAEVMQQMMQNMQDVEMLVSSPAQGRLKLSKASRILWSSRASVLALFVARTPNTELSR